MRRGVVEEKLYERAGCGKPLHAPKYGMKNGCLHELNHGDCSTRLLFYELDAPIFRAPVFRPVVGNGFRLAEALSRESRSGNSMSG